MVVVRVVDVIPYVPAGTRRVENENFDLDDAVNRIIEKMSAPSSTAKAILICRPNSHYFEERTLNLDQPIKIGRSVARAKPSSFNAIFDCKVLSRHHALLWYEQGKFYLQDTKSSNGTFINNNRLSTENHEVSSGDIVQFGVDVLENNRKVTHGCIIATLKLYLPDGKEAKASPSIAEGGTVPLDDLYKLKQIIQEANHREQCLESKLATLQSIVEETKRSAEESWQAYVGEERLLSRLSALETQLQQARTNWSDDKLKEEIAKLRETNDMYQEAAKNKLERIHADKQEAIVLAMEQERAKISAEQDAFLAREQLGQAHVEIHELAKKLTNMQMKAEEERQEHEKHIRELEQHMEEEEAKIVELEAKIYDLTLEISRKHNEGHIEQRLSFIVENDLKMKEEILAENESLSESILNRTNSNGFEQNHISLTVAPVKENCEEEKSEDLECESTAKHGGEDGDIRLTEDGKCVSFKLPDEEDTNEEESQYNPENPVSPNHETVDFDSDQVDSKTLKYQYQSAQREQTELKLKIKVLEKNSEANKAKIDDLNKALSEERDLSGQRLTVCDNLKEELTELERKWLKSSEENRKLIERVNELVNELERKKQETKIEQEKKQTAQEAGSNRSPEQQEETDAKTQNKEEDNIESKEEAQQNKSEELILSTYSDMNSSTLSNASIVSTEQLMNIEEELVLLKEKYAQICEEKVKLQRDLLKLGVKYNMVCENMYNKCFWYLGPLVLLFLYLLIREWIS